ncbi:MAG: diguanylate cyclase [Clostridia bacterium]|nr:diguanylate cyclase [Clostridia bacterium]
MRSLRTRITLMTVCVLLVAVALVTALSVYFIRKNGQRKTDQLLLLLCETGEKNLEYYFSSVQKSVGKVAAFVEADIDGLSDEQLAAHVERASVYFDEMASKSNGVLTYYYRLDPEVSDTVKGFWYVDLDGEGFVEHKVTDITLYDTSDTEHLVWFTVPKYEKKSIWLPPYITDNLDVRVISYNVPIYWRGTFVGVVGIEIDYSTMAEQVDSIRLYDSGYAFLSSADGELFYHPRIDVSSLTAAEMPAVPDGIRSENTFVAYTFDGVEKIGAWLPLSNGMRLNVAAPVSESEGDWQMLILNILIAAAIVVAVAILFTMFYTQRITKPLKELTAAANRVDNGNYDLSLDYNSDDEIGRLTKTFKRLASHMKEHISDLSRQAYVDALTHVKNKAAFTAAMDELEAQINSGTRRVQFAIGVFDCDDLKLVNDQNGHEKGDIYLQAASRAICHAFHHSPVFRIGGDEFAVLFKDEAYLNIDAQVRRFEDSIEEINSANENRWEQVHISMGIASYDPDSDSAASDVVRRADKSMYEHKRRRKKGRI